MVDFEQLHLDAFSALGENYRIYRRSLLLVSIPKYQVLDGNPEDVVFYGSVCSRTLTAQRARC